MSKQYIIGLDLGTTSVKACIFERSGKLITSVEEMITSIYPQQGWVEQDAIKIERQAVLAVRAAIEEAGADKEHIIALSFSAAMHSLLAVDEQGRAISPAMIWADGRAVKQANQLSQEQKQHIFAQTGAPLHPMTPLLKLIWMKENSYQPYLEAAYFMSIKEYIIYHWLGERVIDYAMASATGLFDPVKINWAADALQLAEVNEQQLSKLVPPTEVLQTLKQDIADEMGILPRTPVVVGAADGQLSNLGIGAILPGEIAVSVGTSGAIRQFTHSVSISEKRETFCYAFTSDSFIVGGPTNNGGIVLQWLKELLQDERDYTAFLADADQAPLGADGLLFMPYINGERAPIWNQQAKGNFYGLTITHTKAHLIRAALEGITFNLYQIGKSMLENNGTRKIYVNGGLSRSNLWLQMMADIFDAEIYVSENHHGAAWGAAWTALVALGEEDSFASIKDYITLDAPTMPNAINRERYKQIFTRYEQLCKAITPLFI